MNPRAPLVARKDVWINAAPEAVWQIQADIDRWTEWQTDISKSHLRGALEVGSVFQWTSGGFAVISTLQEVMPQRRLSWTGKAFGSSARHVWTLQPENGGTRVTTEESMEGWLIVVLKPFMPGFLDKSLEVWTTNLKKKAERSAVLGA